MRKILFFIPLFLWTCGGGGGSSPTEPEPPQLPTVTNLTLETEEDTALNFSLQGAEPSGLSLTYAFSSTPSNGQVTLNGAQATYNPNANYNGNDTFGYIATSTSGSSTVGLIIITITAVDDEPSTMDANATTDEDNAVDITFDVTEVDGQNVTFSVTNNPSNGSVSISGSVATYTPNQDWNGTDQFNFQVEDASARRILNTATATITVNPVNDVPVANNVTGSTTSRIGNMSQAVTITLEATDVEGDNLTYSLVSDVSNGTASLSGNVVTYTPTVNYDGTDTFTFKANDGTVDSNTATGTITITDVNNAPIANDMNFELNKNESIEFTLDVSDTDEDNLSKTLVSSPQNGTLTPGTGLIYFYTPNTNYFGTDSFTYKVNDGTIDSEVKTVTFTIKEGFRWLGSEDYSYHLIFESFNNVHSIIARDDSDNDLILEFDDDLNLTNTIQFGSSYFYIDESHPPDAELDFKQENSYVGYRSQANKVRIYDASFNIIQELTISFPSGTTGRNIKDITILDNGEILVSGSFSNGQAATYGGFIKKYDSSGNLLINKNFDNYKFNDTTELSDGNYLTSVSINGDDNYLIKFDQNFNIIWQTQHNGQDNEVARLMVEINNLIYLFLTYGDTAVHNLDGTENSYFDSSQSTFSPFTLVHSSGDFFHIRSTTNNSGTVVITRRDINGNIIWEKDYDNDGIFVDKHRFMSAIEISNGDLIVFHDSQGIFKIDIDDGSVLIP